MVFHHTSPDTLFFSLRVDTLLKRERGNVYDLVCILSRCFEADKLTRPSSILPQVRLSLIFLVNRRRLKVENKILISLRSLLFYLRLLEIRFRFEALLNGLKIFMFFYQKCPSRYDSPCLSTSSVQIDPFNETILAASFRVPTAYEIEVAGVKGKVLK